MPQTTCPLCEVVNSVFFFEDSVRPYYQCNECLLVFVPSKFHLSHDAEKAIYDHHQNSPDDARYRTFLRRLFDPMQRRIAPGSQGLDFGSGPGPTLSVMFAEAGHSMEIYDPFYSPSTTPLAQQYDFISCSEVAEHLRTPRTELTQIWSCLREGGTLGIMTQWAPGQEQFKTWHYKNDPTHVAYFSKPTFEWLAKQWSAELTTFGSDVAIFSKRKPPT